MLIHQHAGRQQALHDLRVQIPHGIGILVKLIFPWHRHSRNRLLDGADGVDRLGMGRHLAIGTVPENLFAGAVDMENIIVIGHRLAASQEKIALVLQGQVENRKQILLQHVLEINQQVAAGNEIQLAKGRILEYIMLGEHDCTANVGIDDVFIALAGEILAETGQGNLLNDIVPVNAAARNGNGILVQISGKQLQFPANAQLLHHLCEDNGDGIGFLTCGAAGDPDAYLLTRPGLPHNGLDNAFLQHIEAIRITEEGSDSYQQFLGQNPGFPRILPQIVHIVFQLMIMSDDHAPLDAPENGALLIEAVIDIGLCFQDGKNLGQKLIVGHMQGAADRLQGLGDMGHLTGNAVRVHHHILILCGNGVTGHAIEFGTVRVLHDDDTVLLPHGLNAAGAIRAHAGQYDRHCMVRIFLGKGAQEHINGVLDFCIVILPEMQDIVLYLHIVFRRNQVHMVPLYLHFGAHFLHRHGGIFCQYLRQHALVIR